MADVVKIGQVIPHNDSTRWHIRKMMDVLQRQGQIEPLQVKVYAPASDSRPASYITFEKDPWGVEIVWAAQELGWDTLLVLVTDRYID